MYSLPSMLLLETSAELTNPRYSLVLMDSRSVAKAADVNMATLGQWIARGLIPGVTVGPSGRRRDFGFETAVRVAIFARLTRERVDPARASAVVANMSDEHTQSGWLLIPPQTPPPAFVCVHFTDVDELIAAFSFHATSPLPEFFVIVDVAQVAERVRKVELEWLASRGATD